MHGIYASTEPLSISFIRSASNLTRDPVPSGAHYWLGEAIEVIIRPEAARPAVIVSVHVTVLCLHLVVEIARDIVG